MQWERIPVIMSSNSVNTGNRMQAIETQLRGMEIALTNSPRSSPLINQEIEGALIALEEKSTLNIEQSNPWSKSNASTVPESTSEEKTSKTLNVLHKVPTSLHELPSIFFMFCLKSLAEPFDPSPRKAHPTRQCNEGSPDSGKQKGHFGFKSWFQAPKRLVPAFKCSVSLGLATMFGLVYSRDNGFWAGLPVAISLASASEATFKVANVKAQGTVIGTVYGVLGCFLFERFLMVRFFSLIPWFIFTNFLRSSRMYGQAGGVSAIIGAVLILGRKDFGPPVDFAIARIVETFIGLSCSVTVEVILSPVRASALAKGQLEKTLAALHDSVSSFDLRHGGGTDLQDGLRKLKGHVNGLSKCISEAEVEPNFWFMPFHSACYSKLLWSLSNMVDLLHFGSTALGTLPHHENPWKEITDELDTDLKLFKDLVTSSVKCFKDAVSVKSLALLDEKPVERSDDKTRSCDLELGKVQALPGFLSGLDDEDEIEKVVGSYVQHAREFVDKICGVEVRDRDEEVESDIALSLSAVGYCMVSLMRETTELEDSIRELIQWENPTTDINLHEISCKVQALYS